MSTLSTNSSNVIDPRDDASAAPRELTPPTEPVYLGLPILAWLQIGVLGVLMLAMYRFNLARLWAKTNPINGEGNWEHAVIIPVIGIYYLYVWRDELLDNAAPDPDAKPEPWTLAGVWGLLLAAPLLLLFVAVPTVLAGYIAALNPALLAASLPSPIPLAAIILAYAAAAAGVVLLKRQDIAYPNVQRWLSAVWRSLGLWIMGTCVLLGLLFFVGVIIGSDGPALPILRYAVAAISLAGLVLLCLTGGRKGSALLARVDAALARSSTWFGAYVMLFGVLFSFYGVWPGQNDFFKDIGMVVSLFGVVLLVGGWRVMRVAWFPVVFLLCAIPWPDQVYSQVAMPLQYFAAKVGVFVLLISGVDAFQSGTKIVMENLPGPETRRVLDVAVACAGLKSLMTFVSLAAALAFLSARPLWQKLVLVASAVPIAIGCNAFRVAGQGLLDRYASHEYSEGFAHAFLGLAMLIPGFFIMLGLWWLLDALFIEEADDPAAKKGAAKLATAGATSTVGAAAKPAAAAKRIVIQRNRVAPAAVSNEAAVTDADAESAADAVEAAKSPTPSVAATTAIGPTSVVPAAVAQRPAGTTPRPAAAPAAAVAPARAAVARSPAASPASPATAASVKPAAARLAAAAPKAAPAPTGVGPAAARPAAAEAAQAKPVAPATANAAKPTVAAKPAVAGAVAAKPQAAKAAPAARPAPAAPVRPAPTTQEGQQ